MGMKFSFFMLSEEAQVRLDADVCTAFLDGLQSAIKEELMRKDDFAAVLDGLQMTVQDEMEREG